MTVNADIVVDFLLFGAQLTLSGRVVDVATGAPIRNADVRIVAGTGFGTHVTTDSNGYYSIPHLGFGRIIVEASLTYTPGSASIIILATRPTTSRFTSNFDDVLTATQQLNRLKSAR